MKFFGKRFSQPGSAPGTLVAREGGAREVRIRVMHYTVEQLEEKDFASAEEALPFVDRAGVVWIDVCGLSDVPTLERLGEKLGLHSLALEDVLHAGQRPKVDLYDDHAFVVLKQVRLSNVHLDFEQVSMFLGDGYVLTLQDSPQDDWEPVRQRLRSGRARIRSSGADYLAYALLDAVIDSYFPLLEQFGDRIEDLQQVLLDQPDQEALESIHAINRELILIRRAAWPHREVVNTLERSEFDLVKKGTRIFLRDCYDHTVQILDILESYRDLARGLMDLYLSTVSNRMNEVMKVLTIMASIFIPLTFLAGIYGMNFDPAAGPLSMPELGWAWGYPAFWVTILLLGAGMTILFKRKKWW
jgi:magnesium transporter